jgi:hypothetical protein
MPDAPEMSTCRHEACHATVARLLNIEVVHATASGDHPHVRTRFQNRDLEKIATVDLSGLATDGSSPETIALDERNAVARCEQSVLMRHGTRTITPDLRDEVTALVNRCAQAATKMVREHKPEIERVARALSAGGVLDQAAIDMAIDGETDEASKSEQIAARLVEALQDAIETLQEISEAKGADDEDDFTRACNAVINMQRTAIDCLRRHGFESRGTPVE